MLEGKEEGRERRERRGTYLGKIIKQSFISIGESWSGILGIVKKILPFPSPLLPSSPSSISFPPSPARLKSYIQ
jgi:hypothetical protein